MATATAGYTLLDDFFSEMLQYCNGAPSIMLRTHLINATIDLCNKSLVLKKNPANFQAEEEVHTYTLKYPQNRYRTIAIDEIRFENSSLPLRRTTETEMDAEYSSWRKMESSTPTRYFLTDDINTIRLWPMPKADINEDLLVKSVVTYKRNQTEVDEFIYEKWHEVIQAGALARILVIPAATWNDAPLANAFGLEFRRGVREARKTTLSGTGKFPGRVIPQSYNVVGSNSNRRSGSWV